MQSRKSILLLIYTTRFRAFLKSGAMSVILLQTDGDDSYQKHTKTRYHHQKTKHSPVNPYVLQAKIVHPVNVHDSDNAYISRSSTFWGQHIYKNVYRPINVSTQLPFFKVFGSQLWRFPLHRHMAIHFMKTRRVAWKFPTVVVPPAM